MSRIHYILTANQEDFLMKNICILFILLILPYTSQAQDITGRVYEAGPDGKKVPLSGVNVYWAGTTIGSTTDIRGLFSIQRLADNHTLIFSYIGYANDTVEVLSPGIPVDVVLSGAVELSDITIHGKRKGSHYDKMNPIVTSIISEAGLQQAACCNLSESFETSASVDVNYSDALTGARQIMMLGLAGIYSQLMTENIPALRGLGSTFGLGYIPGTWMQSIQVSKGTSSVVNGYESITGQINTEFKKPENSEKLFFNVYGNNEMKLDMNVNTSVHINDRWSTAILGHVENLGNRMDMNRDGFMDLPLVRQYNVMNRWKYQGVKGFESRFGFSVIDEKRTAGQLAFDRGMQTDPGNIYGIALDTRRYNLWIKNGYLFPSRPNTSLGLINSFTFHDQQAAFGNTRYSGREYSFYTNYMFQSFIGNSFHSYTTGLSLNADTYRESLNDSAFHRTEVVPGVFYQYTYQPGDNFTLMGGIRADYHNLYGLFFTPRVHVRVNPFPLLTLRGSAGKGYRTANIIAENSYLLASSRNIRVLEDPEQERAWNYGLNLQKTFRLREKDLLVSAEYYRTDFLNQMVVDMEQDASTIMIYTLEGKSYSNAWQFDMSYELLSRWHLNLGYRITDVKTTYDGRLLEKPLVNRYKFLLNSSYSTRLNKWQFDITWQVNGPGRLTSTDSYPPQYRRDSRFPAYHIVHAQVTRRTRYVDIYLGGENLTNFRQENPVLAFDEPFSPYFDASMVWGPITGRMIYLGLRLHIDHN